jgi:hypothetical protein
MKKVICILFLLVCITAFAASQGIFSSENANNHDHDDLDISEYCYVCGRTNEEIREYLIQGFYINIQRSIDLVTESLEQNQMRVDEIDTGLEVVRKALNDLPETVLKLKYKTVEDEKVVFGEEYNVLQTVFNLSQGIFREVTRDLPVKDYLSQLLENESKYKELPLRHIDEANEKLAYYDEQKETRVAQLREQKSKFIQSSEFNQVTVLESSSEDQFRFNGRPVIYICTICNFLIARHLR